MGVRRTAGIVAALALVAAACGADDDDSSSEGAPPSTAGGPTPTTVAATGGWVDGEPEWMGAEGRGGALAESDTADLESAPAVALTEDEFTSDADLSGDDAIGRPEPALPDATPLRAGSVDDNADYQGFLDYLARLRDLGIALRDLDPTDRSIVTVVDPTGAPVAGIPVTISSGDASAIVRTTADGTARFLPAAYSALAAVEGALTASVGEATAEFARGADVTITVSEPRQVLSPVPLDVAFLLDATGSMGDEIDRLKQTIDTVAARVAALDPAPDVRFAMTLYRDEGDAFVTSTYDFTGDVAEFQAALSRVVADGGGDYPEALDEGLAEVLGAPTWRSADDAIQLVFLVADAPPQVTRQVTAGYPESVRLAIERGIKLFPIASSESDDQAEAVFRQIAQATGAPFVFLSYGAGGAATGESTDIDRTDYEELALDELVVRLIAEELAALSGGEVTPPPTTAPPTTNPEGQ
ncbi:MAG: VWA domain-containing protein [Actinomycetota bacterium]